MAEEPETDDPIDDAAFELANIAMALAMRRGVCLPCILERLHLRMQEGLANGDLKHLGQVHQ